MKGCAYSKRAQQRLARSRERLHPLLDKCSVNSTIWPTAAAQRTVYGSMRDPWRYFPSLREEGFYLLPETGKTNLRL